MRFTEIDGKKYDIKCCMRCPFFNYGAYVQCNHPEWDVGKRMEISIFESTRKCDARCPLRDKPEMNDYNDMIRRQVEAGAKE